MSLKEDIQNALKAVQTQGVILCPTDTIWGLSCLATDSNAIEKIVAIKNRPASKSYIVLFDSHERLTSYFDEIPSAITTYLANTTRPTTVILNNGKNLSPLVYGNNQSVAFRIVQDDFCRQLIYSLGAPIVSTSANISGQIAAGNYDAIDDRIKNQVDYIAFHKRNDKEQSVASRIIRWHENGMEIIRD